MNVDPAELEAVMEVIEEFDAVFFGSSTRYTDMVGKLEDILKTLKDKDLSSKIGGAFGSYGWSGKAI